MPEDSRSVVAPDAGGLTPHEGESAWGSVSIPDTGGLRTRSASGSALGAALDESAVCTTAPDWSAICTQSTQATVFVDRIRGISIWFVQIIHTPWKMFGGNHRGREQENFWAEPSTDIVVQFWKRKYVLIKNYISWNINPAGTCIKTFEAFMHITVSKKHALLWAEFKLSLVVGVKIRLTCAPKDPKRGIVRFNMI
jgi:hypothetical protein